MTHEELLTILNQAEVEANKGNYDNTEKFIKKILSQLDCQKRLTDEIEIIKVGKLRADSLLVLARANFHRGNYDQSLTLAEKVIVLAEECNFQDYNARAWNIIGSVNYYLGSYDKALEFYNKSLTAHEKLGEKPAVARVMGNIGSVYADLGSYDKALEFYGKALIIHDELGDKSGVAKVTGNLGIVYLNLGSYDKALEYYTKALISHEELDEKSSVARVTGNFGIVYLNLASYDKALEYYNKALIAHQALGEKSSVARVTGNIGTVYLNLGTFDKALEYFVNALSMNEELGEKSAIADVMGNIGALYATQKFEGYSIAKAEEYLLKAIAIGQEIGAKQNLYGNHKILAELYEREERWKEHSYHFKKFHNLEKEVQSEEATIALQRQVIAEEEKRRELTQAAERAESRATRELLDMVLPPSIATRMIAGEQRIADYYPNISILFADIVGFTAIAMETPPDVVIDFLNYVFDIFDEIIKRNGCEKIKTMGDGYMAVSGAPIECADHAERITRAAFELLQDISLPDEIRRHLPKAMEFNIRVGIHTGAAVCGVIGKERFVWDVYSDAVNTASRMESNGKPGKIHVSREFAWLLRSRQRLSKGNEEFILVEQEEMEIKGKGMMKTYFLEKK